MSTTLLVIQHVDREGPDLIGRLAEERGMTVHTLRPDRGDALPDPGACPNTIALVLGGPMGVSDRHRPDQAWLQTELDWLRAWHRQNRPVIGICLGAQLLATAAGGTVKALEVGEPPLPLREVGIGAIHWLVSPEDEPLLRGLHASEPVLHWHGDRIHLPSEATLLGSSLHCPEQLFRIGHHAVGLQFHWETTGPSLERWLSEDHDYVVGALGRDGPEQVRRQWDAIGATIERRGRRVFSQILDHLSSQLRNNQNATFL